MGTKRLIVNADDFGWTPGITDGILRAHQDGIVTSTSLLANQAASDYAIVAAQSTPRLGVGIHLNLCSGSPVLPRSQVPSLVGTDGKFHPAPEMARRLLQWRVSAREIEAEFRAQIQWLRQRGVNISHADSHYHVHLYPAAVRAFRRVAIREGIPFIRSTRNIALPANGIVPQCHGGPAYRRLALVAYMRTLAAGPFRRLRSADFCLVPPAAYRADVSRLREGWHLAIGQVPAGLFEFSCHPGMEGEGYPESDKLRERREFELRILTDLDLRRLIEYQQIELTNYHVLQNGNAGAVPQT